MTSFKISNIFDYYGIIKELSGPSNYSFVYLYTNFSYLLYHHFLTIVIVISGNSLTKEAQQTTMILGQILNAAGANGKQKIDLIFFLMHANARNLNVQNFLFKINWKVFFTVSFS